MTRKEAIKELKTIYLGDSEQARNAKEMAIRSLGAWDKVQKEIIDKSDTWGDLWTVEAIINVINKHLKEVEL